MGPVTMGLAKDLSSFFFFFGYKEHYGILNIGVV